MKAVLITMSAFCIISLLGMQNEGLTRESEEN